MIQNAFQSIKDDFQRSLFYWLTFVLTTIFMFVFFQIACSPSIGMTFIDSHNSIVTTLSVFVIFICLLSVFFANDFYVKKKSKELAIQLVCGATFRQLTVFLLSQTVILFCLAIPIAFLLSYLLLSLLPLTITFSQEGMNVTLSMMAFEVFWCTILNLGYAYRSSIVMLIQGDRASLKQPLSLPFHFSKQMKKGLILVMFVGPIVLLYIYGKETSSTILFSMIGMIGLYQFLGQIIIPDMDQWIQQKLDSYLSLVYLGFLRRDIIFMKNHIVFQIASDVLMIGLFVMGIDNILYMILIYVSFLATHCLLSLTILFRFSTEMIEREKLIVTLKRIGYENDALKKILRKEIILLYGMILLLGLFYLFNILLSLYLHGLMDFMILVVMILTFMIPLMLCAIVNHYQYQKQMNID